MTDDPKPQWLKNLTETSAESMTERQFFNASHTVLNRIAALYNQSEATIRADPASKFLRFTLNIHAGRGRVPYSDDALLAVSEFLVSNMKHQGLTQNLTEIQREKFETHLKKDEKGNRSLVVVMPLEYVPEMQQLHRTINALKEWMTPAAEQGLVKTSGFTGAKEMAFTKPIPKKYIDSAAELISCIRRFHELPPMPARMVNVGDRKNSIAFLINPDSWGTLLASEGLGAPSKGGFIQ